MKKSTVLSLTTAAVILAAYVPNEVILADTPSSEDSLKISDKETVIGKQNENKEKLEDIHNVIETSKDTEEKKTTIIEEKEVVSKNPVIDNNTSNEEENSNIEEKEVVSKNPVIDNNTSNEEAKIKEENSNQSQGDKADSSASKDPESPKKEDKLVYIAEFKDNKNLEKKQSRNYQILRIQKFYILMIEFLTVALLKQPKILWT